MKKFFIVYKDGSKQTLMPDAQESRGNLDGLYS